jgi:sodium-dependent phosphate cotransporter
VSDPIAGKERNKIPGPLMAVLVAAYFLFLLYSFFFSIELMSSAFKMAGRGFAEQLINMVSDPLAGLLLGFVATGIIQSSSTTTTIVVGLVASGALSIELAVPIIMGARTPWSPWGT